MRNTLENIAVTDKNDLMTRPSLAIQSIFGNFPTHNMTLNSRYRDEIKQAAGVLQNGVPIILSGLKTLLETGTSLT
ncbi:hypothetical protein [Paenibacillus terrigena]|uniref:hypothetical protein n=1 Tax=Paenibacillus terrigena TaxID=369333 RepID=UPI0028D49249|nr:hypothetical protein [Paenibacillus terrigena]